MAFDAEADISLEQLQALFDMTFYQRYNTRLIKGGDEPLYVPATTKTPYHQVILAHGFFRSALHEISHWCIAGEERRRLLDYGYWYKPDGRDAQTQRAFEQVEYQPQALEWIFSKALGVKFRVSLDNLSGEAVDPAPFKRAVLKQVFVYLKEGLPDRANQLLQAIIHAGGRSVIADDFCLEQL